MDPDAMGSISSFQNLQNIVDCRASRHHRRSVSKHSPSEQDSGVVLVGVTLKARPPLMPATHAACYALNLDGDLLLRKCEVESPFARGMEHELALRRQAVDSAVKEEFLFAATKRFWNWQVRSSLG